MPSESDVPRFDGPWREGRRLYFAADTAVVLTAGADPFRIALGLHPETVDRLLSQVLSIQPVGRLPDVGGRRFPGPPPRRVADGSGDGSGRAGKRRMVPRVVRRDVGGPSSLRAPSTSAGASEGGDEGMAE